MVIPLALEKITLSRETLGWCLFSAVIITLFCVVVVVVFNLGDF